jgi:hypothetical protein
VHLVLWNLVAPGTLWMIAIYVKEIYCVPSCNGLAIGDYYFEPSQ